MNTLKRFTFLNKAVRSVEVYSKRQFAIDHNKNYEIASKSSEVTQTDQEKTRWRSRTEIKRTQEYAKATFIKYLRCDWECMGGMAKLAGQKKKTEVAIFEFIEMKDEKNMSDDQKKIATVYQQTLRESSVETWDFSSDAGMYINFLHQHSHARPKVYYSNSEYAELVELTFHESPGLKYIARLMWKLKKQFIALGLWKELGKNRISDNPENLGEDIDRYEEFIFMLKNI